MMNTEFISQFCFCFVAMLASIFISLPCYSRLPSPSLAIPNIIPTTTTPSRIAFSLASMTKTFSHTFPGTIADLSSYSTWLAVKLFITYRASKIFTQASFRSWGRGNTLQTTKLLMSVSAIIGKFLTTISTSYHPHSYIINHKGKYVKSLRLSARGIL